MSYTRPTVYHINLSPSLGGAEVFAGFFSRALAETGWPNKLIVSSSADYWQHLGIDRGTLIRSAGEDDWTDCIPEGAVLVIHSSVHRPLLERISDKARIVGLAHQALYSEKRPAYYEFSETLIPVSAYVADTLRNSNFSNIYPFPLYGIGTVKSVGSDRIIRGPLIDWDERKLRDRMLSILDRAQKPFRKQITYEKRSGLTLGIVSRVADSKQFPLLFEYVAPHIRERREVWLEVFGSVVGVRAFKAFRRAVAPIADRVRYWGFQRDVALVYHNIDYMITGLPEREALGLNVIEAQMCGTPVIAPRAAPFTETIIDRKSGYLYRDPRQDAGLDFARILDEIILPGSRPDPLLNLEHLSRFEFEAFSNRVNELMHRIYGKMVEET